MDVPPVLSLAVDQAAVATHILRVVFNQLTLHDDFSNLDWLNHPVRSCHLADCMRQEKQTFGSSLPYVIDEFRGISCGGGLSRHTLDVILTD